MADVILIFLLFCLNGFFAMCETALVSSRKSRLHQEAKKGSRGATISLKLLEEPEKFLSTVQIGITLIGIIAGAFGGERFARHLQPFIETFPFFRSYAEQISFTLIVIILTYFSLVIGELVPKTIAFNNPEKLTVKLAPFMKTLSVITYPLTLFLSGSTRVILKLFAIKPRNNPPVTEDELKYMIDAGSQHGIIEKGEGKIIHSVFQFGDKKAKDIMTSRKEVAWLNVNHSKDQILNEIFQSAYSKYPVCDGTMDKVIGLLQLTEALKYVSSGNFSVREHLLEPLFFSETTPALNILEEFRDKKIHMGFVVNEKGITTGIITLQDLIENIVGEFPDLEDLEKPTIIKRANGSFLIDADISMEELQSSLNIGYTPLSASYQTLAGFMIEQLQATPRTGSHFIFGKYKFEIIDMDGNRIDKILVTARKKRTRIWNTKDL